jgi:hypothetical protein
MALTPEGPPTFLPDDHYRAQQAAAEAYIEGRASALDYTCEQTAEVLTALGLAP